MTLALSSGASRDLPGSRAGGLHTRTIAVLDQRGIADRFLRIEALRETVSELLSMDEPRRRFAALMSGLDIRYDLGEGHPLLGRRRPDLDLVTVNGPLRGLWEPPDAGAVPAPTAVLIRPDGYVAWAGDRAQPGLADALTTWFGPAAAV